MDTSMTTKSLPLPLLLANLTAHPNAATAAGAEATPPPAPSDNLFYSILYVLISASPHSPLSIIASPILAFDCTHHLLLIARFRLLAVTLHTVYGRITIPDFDSR
ncbi:hypothetical protein BDQ17DRAFT_1538110 [Cyathus striatus]|nr:hypothetical protein BDQ17DRAFT_1538110 [Cyathus striatus]